MSKGYVYVVLLAALGALAVPAIVPSAAALRDRAEAAATIESRAHRVAFVCEDGRSMTARELASSTTPGACGVSKIEVDFTEGRREMELSFDEPVAADIALDAAMRTVSVRAEPPSEAELEAGFAAAAAAGTPRPAQNTMAAFDIRTK